MKLTSKEALDLLNENIGKTSSDKWIKHSKIVPIGTENFDNHPIDNIK